MDVVHSKREFQMRREIALELKEVRESYARAYLGSLAGQYFFAHQMNGEMVGTTLSVQKHQWLK